MKPPIPPRPPEPEAAPTRPVRPAGAAPPFDAVVFALDTILANASGQLRFSAAAADLLTRLRAGGVPVALMIAGTPGSPSEESALAKDFEVVVRTSRGSEGPAADALQAAASKLDASAARIAVVDTAPSGVAAARQGRFGLVVGITRGSTRAGLEAAGADLVLDDVGELDLGVLRTDPWVLAYEGFDPAHEGHREALTTLGNGYLGTRGAAPERAADGVHYPGTYLAGVYNRLTSTVQAGRSWTNTLSTLPTGCRWICAPRRALGGRRAG